MLLSASWAAWGRCGSDPRGGRLERAAGGEMGALGSGPAPEAGGCCEVRRQGARLEHTFLGGAWIVGGGAVSLGRVSVRGTRRVGT